MVTLKDFVKETIVQLSPFMPKGGNIEFDIWTMPVKGKFHNGEKLIDVSEIIVVENQPNASRLKFSVEMP